MLLPLLLESLLGCVAVPLVTPPARFSLVGGPSIPIEEAPQQPGVGVPFTGQLRLGAQPLGLFEQLAERPFDATAGLVVHLDQGLGRAGVFTEASVYLWQESWSPQSRARLRTFGAIDLLAPDVRDDLWEPGLRGGVGIDWGGFVRGQPGIDIGYDASWIGVGYGEWAIGLVAEGGWQRLPEADLVRIALGIEVQMPATAGFLLLPLPRR